MSLLSIANHTNQNRACWFLSPMNIPSFITAEFPLNSYSGEQGSGFKSHHVGWYCELWKQGFLCKIILRILWAREIYPLYLNIRQKLIFFKIYANNNYQNSEPDLNNIIRLRKRIMWVSLETYWLSKISPGLNVWDNWSCWDLNKTLNFNGLNFFAFLCIL